MEINQQRRQAVRTFVKSAKSALARGVTIDSLNQVKQSLLELCTQKHLFPRAEFPVPAPPQTERTFLIHLDTDESHALYVNSGARGQNYRPHDHGESWAIVAAVSGRELHRLYQVEEDDQLHQTGSLTVEPGTAVSMLPGGIHSIHAESDEPLLHLHFYGLSMQRQSIRTEYDTKTGRAERCVAAGLDQIEDMR